MTPTVDIDELIARPLDAIERLRVELKAAGEDAGGEAEESSRLAGLVSAVLLSGAASALCRVPLLSRKALGEGKLPPNSLVRYCGMIQDQYEPEYFVGSFERVETATGRRSRVVVKYADTIAHETGFVNEYDGPGAKTMERLPLFCIPVPGQSPWARPREDNVALVQTAQQDHGQGVPKRQREEAAADEMECCSNDDDGATANGHMPNGHRKNPRVPATATPAGQIGSNKNEKVGDHRTAPAFEHRQEMEFDGLPCVVKVYDFREGLLKLNETVEFVGILAYDQPDPSPENAQEAAGEGQRERGAKTAGVMDPVKAMEEFARKVPPPSLAPRLHCIFHRTVPASAPLKVDPKDSKSALYALQGPLPFGTFMRDMKNQAIKYLAKALGGDVLAAEYTLLTLLSRPHLRTESLAPGSLSLNLRGVLAEDAAVFHAAVSELVPKCARVPVTTESLKEKFKFAPKKDYEADRLMLSNLQLSDGTVVILDETELEPGQIGAEGVSNLSALNSLLSLQKIPYDFGFYKMDFEVDHPSISVSLGRSVVPTSASFPVVPSSACGGTDFGWNEAVTASGATETGLLTRLRVYIEATRRMELSLDEQSSKMAEDDFVKTRQQGQEVTGEDFHRWLTVARLTALSLGDPTVTSSHWSYMKRLEARTAARAEDTNNDASMRTSSNGRGAGARISPNKATSLNVIPES